MSDARLHLVTDEQLEAYARRVARAAVLEVLAEVGALLPPFTQHALPPHCRRKDFLAAVASGCPHRKRGRVYEVERAAWQAWRARPIPIAATPPIPDNDAQPPPKRLDIAALTAEALRGRRG